MTSELQKQCVKSVNEYVERADGNYQAAEKLFFEEVGQVAEEQHASWNRTGWSLYLYAMEDAFNSLRPQANG